MVITNEVAGVPPEAGAKSEKVIFNTSMLVEIATLGAMERQAENEGTTQKERRRMLIKLIINNICEISDVRYSELKNFVVKKNFGLLDDPSEKNLRNTFSNTSSTLSPTIISQYLQQQHYTMQVILEV